jgi:hypothetical protein
VQFAKARGARVLATCFRSSRRCAGAATGVPTWTLTDTMRVSRTPSETSRPAGRMPCSRLWAATTNPVFTCSGFWVEGLHIQTELSRNFESAGG